MPGTWRRILILSVLFLEAPQLVVQPLYLFPFPHGDLLSQNKEVNSFVQRSDRLSPRAFGGCLPLPAELAGNARSHRGAVRSRGPRCRLGTCWSPSPCALPSGTSSLTLPWFTQKGRMLQRAAGSAQLEALLWPWECRGSSCLSRGTSTVAPGLGAPVVFLLPGRGLPWARVVCAMLVGPPPPSPEDGCAGSASGG